MSTKKLGGVLRTRRTGRIWPVPYCFPTPRLHTTKDFEGWIYPVHGAINDVSLILDRLTEVLTG